MKKAYLGSFGRAVGCAEGRSASIAEDVPPSSAHPTHAAFLIFR